MTHVCRKCGFTYKAREGFDTSCPDCGASQEVPSKVHICTHCDKAVDAEADFVKYESGDDALQWSAWAHVDCALFKLPPGGAKTVTLRRDGHTGVATVDEWCNGLTWPDLYLTGCTERPPDLLDERAQTHGDYATTALIAQGLKAVIAPYTTHLSAAQCESLDLICTKIARICSGNPDEPDHWCDIEGYARLVTRMLEDK